jgi:hypothetical protein
VNVSAPLPTEQNDSDPIQEIVRLLRQRYELKSSALASAGNYSNSRPKNLLSPLEALIHENTDYDGRISAVDFHSLSADLNFEFVTLDVAKQIIAMFPPYAAHKKVIAGHIVEFFRREANLSEHQIDNSNDVQFSKPKQSNARAINWDIYPLPSKVWRRVYSDKSGKVTSSIR